MAKTAVEPPGASGSQFFVVTAPADAGLPPDYAVLGKVGEGTEVVDAIGKLGDPTEQPTQVVTIDKVSDRGRLSARVSEPARTLGGPCPESRSAIEHRISSSPGPATTPIGSPTCAGAGWCSPSIRATSPRSARASSAPTATPPTTSTTSTPRCSGSRRSRSTRTSGSPASTAHRAAARRPRPRDLARLRGRRPRRPGPALDLHRRPRGDRPLPPRRPARAALQGRRAPGRGALAGARRGRPPSERRAACRSRSRGPRRRSPARPTARGTRSCSCTGSPRPAATSSTARGSCRGGAFARSPTTPAATASPIRRPAGDGYGYEELAADLGAVIDEQAGDRRCVLAGHSMGAHTLTAHALAAPDRVAALVAIGPVFLGIPASEESLAYWDWLADGLERGGVEGFVAAYDHDLDPEWRETLLRITRERLGLHRHPEAVAQALREVPRSQPVRRPRRARVPRPAGAGRRQPRRGRPGPSLRGRRGLGGAAAAGDPGQRGAGGVAARLAGRQALARDRRLLRAPRGRRAGSAPASDRGSRAGRRAAGPTRSRRSRRPCCRPGRRRARARGRRPR